MQPRARQSALRHAAGDEDGSRRRIQGEGLVEQVRTADARFSDDEDSAAAAGRRLLKQPYQHGDFSDSPQHPARVTPVIRRGAPRL